MPYIVFAWLALFFFGFETIATKLSTKYAVRNPWLLNFLWEFVILILMIPFALANGVGIPREWGDIILAAILGAFVGIAYILALSKMDVSVVSPLFNLRTVFTVILGALFLGEILTPYQYFLIAVIFIFGILVSLDEKFSLKSFFQKPVALAMGLMLGLSLSSIYIRKSIAASDYWTATLWIQILMQVFLLPTAAFFMKDLRKLTKKQISATGILGVISTAGVLFSNRAYRDNVSVSTVIISLPFSMVLAFLFSIFAPKLLEKHTLKIYTIRFAAAAVMFIAALKLSG